MQEKAPKQKAKNEIAHKKKETQQTLKNQKPSNLNAQEAHPTTTREPCLSSAERM
jgi:hypothetical protein